MSGIKDPISANTPTQINIFDQSLLSVIGTTMYPKQGYMYGDSIYLQCVPMLGS